MHCRYCRSEMFPQDNDNMGYGLYSRIYVCCNDECRAVYERWTTAKGAYVREKSGWFDPKQNEFIPD